MERTGGRTGNHARPQGPGERLAGSEPYNAPLPVTDSDQESPTAPPRGAEAPSQAPPPLASVLVRGLGLGLVAGMLGLGFGCAPPAQKRNLILISVDTLRADRLGCYGYERPTSPTIDRLAREGVLFLDASAPSPWTLPSHATMFTGLYPRRNGVTGTRFTMPEDVPTLAGILQRLGYATAGVVTNSLLTTNGLDRGFQDHEEVDKGGPHPSATSQRGVEWLRQRDLDRPFFLLLHYIDPHSDYGTLDEIREQFVEPYDGELQGKSDELYAFVEGRLEIDAADARHLSNLYDGAIRQLDGEIAKVLEYLEQEGLLENTVIAFTSDHGEEFLDHGGVLHGLRHYEELARVPFLIRGPDVPAGRVVDTPVGLIDLVPTCLRELGLPAPDDLDGIALQPLWRDGPFPARRLYFEADLDGSMAGSMIKGQDRGIRDERFKLHYNVRTKEVELFDLRLDPGEREDVKADHPDLVRELLEDLRGFLEASRDVPARALTEEDLERLRELGYAGGEDD